MPHFTLEYTANLTQPIVADQLFRQLHQVLADVGGVNVDNCKSRAVPRSCFFVGRGDPRSAFVHLDLGLLDGKPAELKRKIGEQCMAILETYFASSAAAFDLQITVEIRDMARQAYFKVPAPPCQDGPGQN